MKPSATKHATALDGNVGNTRYALLAESLLEKINSGDYNQHSIKERPQ